MTERARISNANIIHETIDDDVLVINLETSTYYGLRDVGAVIWCFVQSSATVDEIVEAVASRYQGARESIQQAVKGLLAELSAEALIVLDSASPAPALATDGVSTMASIRLPFSLPRLEKFTDLRFYTLTQ